MISIINKIINNDLNTYLNQIFPNGKHLEEATSQPIVSNVSNLRSSISQQTSIGTGYAEIYRHLGHIEVNPQRPDNTSSLRYTYVFGTRAALDEKKWLPVNSSQSARANFVNEVISRAVCRQTHYLEKQRTGTNGSGFDLPGHLILSGPRGCGKTYYLNHVLSRHSHSFDAKKVVWVRLNLAKNFGKASLTDRLWAQTTKLLLRYYDPSSKFCPIERLNSSLAIPISDLIKEFINTEENLELRSSWNEKWALLCSAWMKGGSEPLFEPSNYPATLCKQVYDIALSRGLAFVMVLDGLDCLDYVAEAEHRYGELINGCESLSQNEEQFGATFIFVVRDTSTQMHRILQPIAAHTRSKPLLCQINLPTVIGVVQRRIDFLKKKLKKLQRNDLNSTEKWKTHLENFLQYLLQTAGSELRDLEITGFNRRCAMQVVQAKYRVFLSDETTKEYRLTEVLCTKGEDYPSNPYSYLDLGIKWERHAQRGSVYDSHFLPKLIGAPFATSQHADNSNQGSHIRKHLLAPLRVLQLLDNFGRSNKLESDSYAVHQVQNILKKFFDYDSQVIAALIEELVLFECILFKDGDSSIATELITRHISITTKGKTLYQKYFEDATYLSLCSMLIPIDCSPTRVPYFLIGSPFGKAQDWENWVATKLINCISAVRLIEHINKIENEKYLKKSQFFPVGDAIRNAYDNGIHGYFRRISTFDFRNKVFEVLTSIIASLPNKNSEEHIAKRIYNHYKVWTNL